MDGRPSLERVVREHMAASKTPGARRVERMGVPVVDSLWPEHSWIACVVYPHLRADGTLLPWDEEIAQVVSYIDFTIGSVYNAAAAARIRTLSLPLMRGHNTVILSKKDGYGWGYRRGSWLSASWPHAWRGAKGCPEEPQTLVQILDKITSLGDKPSEEWRRWKAEHQEVFERIIPVA